ncbi:scopoletin glucosyltransferase-like [Oryza brachyantha]|uniref:Glycosyltransferase n=1 Tax=Oryza brachyantha TaxID=4533 RepID=J3L279_ORYBR|nr:scopoletin glucosyltransferase-like [Oryza brachyantha]
MSEQDRQSRARSSPAMAVSEGEQQPLHILFFPFIAHGHLIPVADMAALFATRGVKCTILTTPANAEVIRPAVDRANDASRATGAPEISITLFPFPDVSLPPGVENIPSMSMADRDKMSKAFPLFREPFDRFLAEHHPDAVVADSFFPWSADAAAEHGVPRLSFLGSSLFARACTDSMLRNNPVEASPDDPDAIVSLPDMPHRVELRRSQMMDAKKHADDWAYLQLVNAADQRSFGELFNSFHEMEADYVEHYHAKIGRRAWFLGPVALATKGMAARQRTGHLSPDAERCLRWLDQKAAGSVVYISFGTLARLLAAELREIARALQLTGTNFLWIITREDTDASEWMPEGFADLVARGERGLIVRGWAPQVLVLNHPAVGGFVTHCGWNSVLEAVCAGVPMVTYPRYTDQFYNEKLIVETLKVGVGVGAGDFASFMDDRSQVIEGEVIAEAIETVMGEGEAIRRNVKELSEKARSAVQEGGSSYDDAGRLLDELMARRSSATA